jgi:hypothetical protein
VNIHEPGPGPEDHRRDAAHPSPRGGRFACSSPLRYSHVLSAQNAIQATDYASATSNLSKYEVPSQTGISALAQANSLQQEVTKLLQ